ncbi:adenylate/guanylate cyclase domain-containing protein [Taibaiella koreensis]|uniref:adenylate/guanylate cyclase domain-containing protein n=1 Tax=Taibaiella koreensis TaxID=1268548 RepID=UPI000E59F42B|nr:adenylate/guanylate cyclase domain-containing protein [Taibaiella koreensis]
MKFGNRLKYILFSVVYWLLACHCYIILRFIGIDGDAAGKIDYGEIFFLATFDSIVIGFLFGVFTSSSLSLKLKRRAFFSTVLINTVIYVCFFGAVIFGSSLVGNTLAFAIQYSLSSASLVTLFYLSVCSLLYHFILQMNKKFGPGVLFEYIIGKYFNPKEEKRVFMFLDLTASTTIAESLDTLLYSQFLQSCYIELTEPISAFSAHVYQFVGDEVVVTWKVNKDFDYGQCVNFYFAFANALLRKKDYFLETFGVQPLFKAGIHSGTVVAAEVGELKTEIAYHGDVVNTASRIQGLCNQHSQQLLISESIFNPIAGNKKFALGLIGDVQLKGKYQSLKVYSVQLKGA